MQTARAPHFQHVLTCAIAAVTVLAGAATAQAATITVTSNNIVNDGLCDPLGHCSLPEAIINANGTGAEDTINFNAAMTITVSAPSALPSITTPVKLVGGTNTVCAAGARDVTITGHTGATGLLLEADADTSELCRLKIQGFGTGVSVLSDVGDAVIRRNVLIGNPVNGMQISGATASVVGNLIGIDEAGTTNGNGQGVSVSSSTATIGGTGAADRNIISGNAGNGVVADAGTIIGNRIGTTADGTAARPNGAGVNLSAGSTAAVGGAAGGERNLISGNVGPGVRVFSTGATVRGNLIGTNAAGTAAVPNDDGVHIREGADGLVLGGTGTGDGNLISGNTSDGIEVAASGVAVAGVAIQGNAIGLAGDQLTALPNGTGGAGGAGIRVGTAASTVTVGGTAPGAGNRISGNATYGVFVEGDGTQILQNAIGLNLNEAAVSNTTGIRLGSTSSATTIGGTTAAARNVISGNTTHGILLGQGSTTATVQGNYIGLATDGTTARPNGAGIRMDQSATAQVGGTATGAGNVISANTRYGVEIIGGSSLAPVLEGNFIGTDAAGLLARGNTQGGILLAHSQDARIGGTAAGARNVISGNLAHGLDVQTGTIDPQIHGNLIGLGADGTTPVGNAKSGVFVQHQIFGVTVGGTSAGQGNTIRHNTEHGIEVGPAASFVLQTELLGNSVRDNGKLGIDLGDDGVTANDAGDGDVGDNDRQNFPVVTGASTDGTQTSVTGTIDTTAGHQIRIEVFSSAACDPSGHGEGDTFLGAAEITSAAGPTPFTATVAATDAARQLTTTATDLTTSQTSEFSACQAIAFVPPPTPIFTGPSSPVLPPAPAAGGTPTTTTAKVPAKLKVRRAGIDGGVLDLLVEITSAAATSGAKLELDYESSGRRTTFSVPITTATKASGGEALLKIRKKLPSTQSKDTGIIEIAYAGNTSVAPDEVRLRAADVQALLVRSTTSLNGGRLRASGTVSSKARGVVRLRLGYTETNGASALQSFNVTIKNGRWSLDRQLTGTAAAGGYLSIQFTGYESAGMRGEQTGKQLP